MSNGFSYSDRLSAPPGERVDPTSIKIKGRVISPDEKVRVATNDILAAGGARFAVFERGTDRLGVRGTLIGDACSFFEDSRI